VERSTRTLIIIHRTDGATAYNGRRMDSTGSAGDFEPIRERVGEGLHAVLHVDFVACDARKPPAAAVDLENPGV
jgi:hypothetical protein